MDVGVLGVLITLLDWRKNFSPIGLSNDGDSGFRQRESKRQNRIETAEEFLAIAFSAEKGLKDDHLAIAVHDGCRMATIENSGVGLGGHTAGLEVGVRSRKHIESLKCGVFWRI
jgi:hypothetical protein